VALNHLRRSESALTKKLPMSKGAKGSAVLICPQFGGMKN